MGESNLLGGSFIIFGRTFLFLGALCIYNQISTENTKNEKITGSLAQKIPSHVGG